MLLLSLLWAAMAWLAYKPKSTSTWLGLTSFVFGYVVGELGLHLIAVQIALTLLVILFGELSGFGDALALAISVASWVAIGLFYFRAQAVEQIAAKAVEDVIGSDANDEVCAMNLTCTACSIPWLFAKPMSLWIGTSFTTR